MSTVQRRGTWIQRWLKNVFTFLFGVLVFWLLGFLIDDLGHLQSPNFSEIEKQMLDPSLVEQSELLERQSRALQQDISSQKTRQSNLRDSTSNAQTTMNQLLAFQKLSLEKNVKPTEEEQRALAESQKVFLSNQQQYQQLTEQVGELQIQLNTVSAQLAERKEALEVARKPVWEEYQRLVRKQALWEAGIKLGILTPLLLISLGLFFRSRQSLYVPFFVAFAIAVGIKVLIVMNEYFPGRSFKYVLLITFLIVITRALMLLLKSIAQPGAQSLLNQYREAYEHFLCPNCSFPIRRGPLKFQFWTRRTIKKLKVNSGETTGPDSPYCCPSCSTRLFDECGNCHNIRHSLLPSCEHCGQVEPIPVENSTR
ncbi:MAG TPA: hypothetical protein VNQ76_04490 [Planctomicrobium sp.]|nr:hypothetical protein [Planctomicrobium sp.]